MFIHISCEESFDKESFKIESNYTRGWIDKKDLPVFISVNNYGELKSYKEKLLLDPLTSNSRVKLLDKPKKMFLSGPMTDYFNFNFDMFNILEEEFKKLDINVVNPVKICKKYKLNDIINNKELFNKMINEELEALKTCDAIYMLYDWENSAGAKKELQIALENNLKIILQVPFNIFKSDENKDFLDIITE